MHCLLNITECISGKKNINARNDGRLTLIELSEPRNTIYVLTNCIWYDVKWLMQGSLLQMQYWLFTAGQIPHDTGR